jgi:hypothetical protein
MNNDLHFELLNNQYEIASSEAKKWKQEVRMFRRHTSGMFCKT